jgi:hypothetical protein
VETWGLTFDISKTGVIHKKVGHDFPGETFRVLKEKEEKQYGDSAEQLCKRKSNRMVLGAF